MRHGAHIRISCGYFDAALNEPEKVAERLRALLTAYSDVQPDTLVGTGLSGALILPTLARVLDVKFLVVRKPNDGSHSWTNAEGDLGQRWLFVDDLIDSGSTLRRVQEGVRKAASNNGGWQTDYVGAYLYRRNEFHRPGAECNHIGQPIS